MTVKSGTQSGAVTLIQRFGSALNLTLHFHMLYLNGVYDNKGCSWPVKPLTPEDLEALPIRSPNAYPDTWIGQGICIGMQKPGIWV